jgi:hypothetical protein
MTPYRCWPKCVNGVFGPLRLYAVILMILGGCATKQPPAAENHVRGDEPELAYRAHLNDVEQGDLRAAMRSAAGDHRPARHAVPAEHGLRWSDLPDALYHACEYPGVEVTVLETIEVEWGYLCTLRTVEDWPGALRIYRRPAPEIYAAEATIGRFPERDACRARAQALIDALHEQMLAFGRKRAYQDQAD